MTPLQTIAPPCLTRILMTSLSAWTLSTSPLEPMNAFSYQSINTKSMFICSITTKSTSAFFSKRQYLMTKQNNVYLMVLDTINPEKTWTSSPSMSVLRIMKRPLVPRWRWKKLEALQSTNRLLLNKTHLMKPFKRKKRNMRSHRPLRLIDQRHSPKNKSRSSYVRIAWVLTSLLRHSRKLLTIRDRTSTL